MRPIIDDTPEDPRAFIPYIEFYITNVCNINCSNCNRFNNYNFAGTQRWEDYEDIYREWGKHVRFQAITILGGEPLLNPTLCDWVDGINNIWDTHVQVLTNGTRLNKFPNLYDRLRKFNERNHKVKNWIGVSIHNEADRERCFAEIRKFLRGEITYYNNDSPENVNNAKTYGGDHAFVDESGMAVRVWEYLDFSTAAVQPGPNGRLTLFNHDPETALRVHDECGFVRFRSHHMIKGKLYKCGPVALFPDFDRQFNLDISDEDRKLINSYRPLSVDEFETRGKDFLAHINDPIPQCKFCPLEYTNTRLAATSKKPGSTSAFD